MITCDKRKSLSGGGVPTLAPMPRQTVLAEAELAALAKRCREAAGRNRAAAARELGVARQAVIYAEDRPEKSFTKLRCRIIEAYSPLKVTGPVFLVAKK
jgi:DNA-binding XRE family transcriptional regulator